MRLISELFMTQPARITAMAMLAFCCLAADNSNGKPQNEVIGPADTLSILVLDSEELSKSWRVNATGDVNLPLVGRMDAAGLTVEQFQQELVQRLRKYYWNPEVTVFIAEFRSQPITVTGAVDKPGTTQLENSRTLFEALMRAGGPKEAGDKVTLTRALERGRIAWPGAKQQDQTYSVATLSLKNVMDGRSPEANIPVQAYDVISVLPGREQKLVYIIGGVNKPGAVELITQDRVSLLKALATAGGLAKGAVPAKTQVMHIGPGGLRTEQAVVNLKTILAGKANDLDLMAGDVVVIPASNGLTNSIQAVALSAVSASMYVILAAL